jgi:hypothetical protein
MSTAQVALDFAGASLGVSVVSVITSVATWLRPDSQRVLVCRRLQGGRYLRAARAAAAAWADAIGDHRPGNGAQHREPDGAARLTSGVEQAGGRPGVRLWDAG